MSMEAFEAAVAEIDQVIEVEGLVVSTGRRIDTGAEFTLSLSEPFMDFGEATVRVPSGLASFVITRFRRGAKVEAEGEYSLITDEAGEQSLVLESSTVGIIAERFMEL